MRWMYGVAVCALFLGAQGWGAPAMAQQPSDLYLSEFLWGEVGAVVGGISLGGGTYLLGSKVLNCGEPEPGPLCFIGPMELIVTGSFLGITIGSGLGVTWAGDAGGVAGNGVGAYVGALLGTGVGMFTGVWSLLVAPVAFAVIGYNVGATMKDTGQPVTLPWRLDLPVLSLAF